MAKRLPPVAHSWNILADVFVAHPAVSGSPVLMGILRDAYFCGAAMAVSCACVDGPPTQEDYALLNALAKECEAYINEPGKVSALTVLNERKKARARRSN